MTALASYLFFAASPVSFTQAGMTDAAIEWWGKAGDQALRRSAFQEAISHLGKAIEMADKSADTTPQTTKPEVARAKLQTNFGIALLAARGDSAPETTAAFARAEELAAAVDDQMERLSANYGLWTGYLSRGEVGPLRAIAEVVLRDIEGKPPSPEAAVAHRLAGTTEWYLGNFELARAHLEQALAMFDPRRDHHLTYRFGRDTGVSAMVFMALALWPLGETDRACRIGEEMLAPGGGKRPHAHYGLRAFSMCASPCRQAGRGHNSAACRGSGEVGARTWHGALQRLW